MAPPRNLSKYLHPFPIHRTSPPLAAYLSTALKTQNLSSRVSNKQAVFLRSGASSSTVWQFQKTTHGKDGGVERILGVGSPVSVGSEVRSLLPWNCMRSTM